MKPKLKLSGSIVAIFAVLFLLGNAFCFVVRFVGVDIFGRNLGSDLYAASVYAFNCVTRVNVTMVVVLAVFVLGICFIKRKYYALPLIGLVPLLVKNVIDSVLNILMNLASDFGVLRESSQSFVYYLYNFRYDSNAATVANYFSLIIDCLVQLTLFVLMAAVLFCWIAVATKKKKLISVVSIISMLSAVLIPVYLVLALSNIAIIPVTCEIVGRSFTFEMMLPGIITTVSEIAMILPFMLFIYSQIFVTRSLKTLFAREEIANKYTMVTMGEYFLDEDGEKQPSEQEPESKAPNGGKSSTAGDADSEIKESDKAAFKPETAPKAAAVEKVKVATSDNSKEDAAKPNPASEEKPKASTAPKKKAAPKKDAAGEKTAAKVSKSSSKKTFVAEE